MEEAPGASHKAGSDSSDTAGTVAPAAMHQGTDRSDQMMRAQDPEKSYEQFPAGTELCITADISRTYPVGMQGPVSERVPRWSVTRYAVVPLKERRASRWEGLRGKVSAHVPAQSSKRGRGRRRAKRNGRNGRTTIHGGEQPGRGGKIAVSDGKELIAEEQRPHASAEGPRLCRLDRQKQQYPAQQGREEGKEVACEETSEPPDMSVDELVLRGTFRSAPFTAKVSRADWRDCRWADCWESVHWVLARAIRKKETGGQGGNLGPLILWWTRRGERLRWSDAPTDFTSLVELWREGWEFDATKGQMGGSDSPQAEEDDGEGYDTAL